MKTLFENNVLTIFLDGRIDASVAEKVSAEVTGALEAHAGEKYSLIMDASSLEYISSAGLRMILKAKKANADMKIVNVETEVYEIFEMTGFTEIITVEKAFRKFSVDGCAVIGKGAKGTVYRYNEDIIVKVYNNSDSLPDIMKERELARKAFILGIPTAISYDIVKVGEKFGSVFELLDARSYSQMILDDPDNMDKYVDEYAALLKKIHSTPVKPDDMPDIKKLVSKWVETDMAYLGDDGARVAALVEKTPDVCNMLHCDYHTNNVMLQNGETLLIDMDTLSHGHPVFELGNVYITYVGFGEEDPTVVEKFLGLPYATACRIWKRFIASYLGTDDEKRIAEVEEKAKLVSYVRLMRHVLRRGGADTPEGMKTVEMCRRAIHELLEKVTELDF